ncbi:MAG: succinate dehydrogenase [Blautia sp.]|nr:succinate dehydrogenase [Blautia sp.]
MRRKENKNSGKEYNGAIPQLRIDILRRNGLDCEPFWQSFEYTPRDISETVASALTRLNEQEELQDINGNPAGEIRWESSCLQKKCGACAMVICGKPMLACDAVLMELKQPVRLEPLRKFPVVADLMTDRTVMFRNLKEMEAWLEDKAEPSEKKNAFAHEASRCLQCGCCLEVCPNFMPEGRFFGMASMVPSSRILNWESVNQNPAIKDQYRYHIYDGCGKSLACQNICPAGIRIEDLMSRSNAAAVWRASSGKKSRGM